jgi:hypothetical protein
MTYIKTIIFIVSLACSLISNAQTYGNNWCFGNGIKLNFNDCSVKVGTSSNTGTEGCSTISNINGDLLFYTNSNFVWDSTGAIMSNGNLGGSLGSHSQVIIIPKPQSTNIFYIFTTQLQTLPSNRKFQYHEIDMSLNSGLGEVTTKNIELHSSPTNEEVTATYHNDGINIWVVTHEYGTNNFLSYLVTSSGVSSSPIISSVGSAHETCSANVNSRGNMKFSPDGTKIAFNGNGENNILSTNILELFDFDNTTGIVSNPITLPFLGDEYGLSFSPNSLILYCSTWSTGSITSADSNYLYQFDISSNDSTSIANSRTILHSDYALDSQFGTINITPNGKVYVAKHDEQYLGVINNPNVPGTACNYVNNGFYLNGLTCNFGLNNYIEYKTYCNNVGLEEKQETYNLKLYPNPLIDKLFISSKKNELVEINIYNILGELLYSKKILSNTTIDLAHLKNGLLIVNVKSKNSVFQYKLLKI